MNCLSCRMVLTPETVAGVELDRCLGCGGFWFDAGEMNRLVPLLARSPEVPNLDLNIVHEEARLPISSSQRSCPRCHLPMNTFNYCYDSNIMLDRCGSCRGVWMDGGELEKVLQYVKGHPKLDRMGETIGEHVSVRMDAQFPEDKSDDSPILPAILDIFLRWGR